MKTKLTTELGEWLQEADEHFDNFLFNGKLPNHVVSISDRRDISDGYTKLYSKKRDGSDEPIHEIYLNRELFSTSIDEVYIALIHQQLRLYQWSKYDKPKLGYGYHDKNFAELARIRGLIVKGTGKDEGKDSGWNVELYIEHKGLAMQAFQVLPNKLKTLPLKSLSSEFIDSSGKKPKRQVIRCVTCGFEGQFTGINSHFRYCPMCADALLVSLNIEPTMVVRE